LTQKIEIDYDWDVVLEGVEPEKTSEICSLCIGCYIWENDLEPYGCGEPLSLCLEHNIIWKRKE